MKTSFFVHIYIFTGRLIIHVELFMFGVSRSQDVFFSSYCLIASGLTEVIHPAYVSAVPPCCISGVHKNGLVSQLIICSIGLLFYP